MVTSCCLQGETEVATHTTQRAMPHDSQVGCPVVVARMHAPHRNPHIFGGRRSGRDAC